jgi:hypothetical protein
MPRLSSENPAWKELEYASSVTAHNPANANRRLEGGAAPCFPDLLMRR